MGFIKFNSITKRFPGVLALDGVSFEIERGSCHALMGENGAGKSTLGKILAGVYVGDAGEVLLDGKPIDTPNPLAARKLGIAMVHQELAFCANLTVAENLCLGELPARAGWLDRRPRRACGLRRPRSTSPMLAQPALRSRPCSTPARSRSWSTMRASTTTHRWPA
jgi:ABC-type sugar transport system ATPase subunit